MSGLHVERTADDIYVMYVGDASRATVNDWADQLKALYAMYQRTGGHLRLLYQFERSILPTPYLLKRAIGVINNKPVGLNVSAAIIVPNSNIYMGMHYIMSRLYKSDHMHLIDNYEEGIDWLQKRDPDTKQNPTKEQNK
ncbi:MAG: hypothetical protein KC615_17140 [Anaerolineae bacterium]|nr:hypothetical protein [Anaerolineae bacterium]